MVTTVPLTEMAEDEMGLGVALPPRLRREPRPARQLSADDAYEVAHRVRRLRGARLEEQASKKKAGRTKMVLGALVCLAGIVVTVGSYLAASSGGGYILAWGAILFGALLFLWGWEQARRRE